MNDSARKPGKASFPVWSMKDWRRSRIGVSRPFPRPHFAGAAYRRQRDSTKGGLRDLAYSGLCIQDGPGIAPAARTFLSAVKPFLQQVWPQERSLATSGVSSHFSRLPAVSGEAFAEAVDEVSRFLVPFDCSSLLAYGFNESGLSEDFGMPRLSDAVDDSPKAHALLRLLNLTVGESQDAVIPDDLGTALDCIESLASELTSSPAFRRLAAAARR